MTNLSVKLIKDISVPATIERRKKAFELAGAPFFEIICYRKGESGSWKEELKPETIKIFKKFYPNLSE